MKKIVWLYHLLITTIFRIKRFVRLSDLQNSDRRIMLFHEVDISEEKRFTEQIENCSKNWNFINPDQLVLKKNGIVTRDSRELILTFDDGFSSDFRIAQNVLNPRGIKAIFFIIPEFVSLATEGDQTRFISDRLYPGTKTSRVPTHLRSMNWEQISILSHQGHTIGSHSYSHRRLSEITNEDELAHEIVDSGRSIENVIKKKVDHFAFPFGNLSSMSLRALQMARDNYRYIYSGLRGSNYQISAENVLRRETIFPWDPKGFESAVLSGAGDSRFRSPLSVMDCWANEISKRAKS